MAIEATAIRAAGRRGGLLKVLGLAFGLSITVGSMIGGGILRGPGAVAGHLAAPALVLALWLAGGVHSALECNLVAELSTAFPRAGGSYVYAERAFGRLGGLAVGWADWVSNSASIAALGFALAEFAGALSPWIKGHVAPAAMVMEALLFVLSAFGVREGAWFQNLVTLAKFVALALIVLAALALLPAASSTGTGRAAGGLAGGLTGGILAYQLIVGAYTGWNSPAYFAEETRDPGRAIPRSMFMSVAAVALLYVAINGALLRGLTFPHLAASDLPLADLSARLIGPAGAIIFTLVAIAAVASCLNGTIMLTPRILFALARDRLFPAVGSLVNRGGSPVLALAATGLISLILTATASFDTAFRLLGLFTVLINVVMNLALFRLRASRPEVERPFRAWLFPYAPLLALVLDLGLVGAFAWADPKGALWGALLLLGAIPVWLLMRLSRPARRGSA